MGGSLELLGIPQVAVRTNDEIYKIVDNNQNDPGGVRAVLDDSIEDVNIVGPDFQEPGSTYYSAASYSKFKMTSLKKVFSESEFNCCVPSGEEIPASVTPAQCCTGYVANDNNIRRCCLQDFTDLTVYLNRYVSSEGRGASG